MCQNDPEAKGTPRLMLVLVKFLKLMGEQAQITEQMAESVENLVLIFNSFFSLITDSEVTHNMIWELLKEENNEDDLWDFMEVWSPDRDLVHAGLGSDNLKSVKQICAFFSVILR